MLKKPSLVLAAALACGAMSAQSVTYPVTIDERNFPDATLRGIISTKVYDRDGDGQLSQAEAERVTSIDISERGISDVTGIEYFVNVEELYVYSNNISTLNLAPFAKLVDLACGTNPIATLDLAANPDLTYLACGEANLTTLNTAANKKLQAVICNSNALTALDFSANTQLVDLNCADNQLTTLNISGCSALANLDCSNNALTALDLAGKKSLTLVYCKNNKIESLNLSSATMLMCLECDNNALAALNLDGIVLQYSNNISNQSRGIDLDANGAVDLTTLDPKCMDVSRISDLSGGTLDGTTLTFAGETVTYKYATKCKNTQYGSMDVTLTANKKPVEELLPIDEEHFPDDNFRSRLRKARYDKDQDGYFSKEELSDITYLSLDEEEIEDVTGIGYFFNLEDLDLSKNSLTAIDLGKNTKLTKLTLSENRLTALDLSNNTLLTYLNCEDNEIAALDVSVCPGLTELNCSRNKLTTLDVSHNTALTSLSCDYNTLNALNLATNTALTVLSCESTALTTLDLAQNKDLKMLFCENNQIATLDLSANTALETLVCYGNQLTALDVTANTALRTISVNDNKLSTIDVSKNTLLITLLVSNNALTSLKVSDCPDLNVLTCERNKITSLDISKNSHLSSLQCGDNAMVALDLSANTLYNGDMSRTVNTRNVTLTSNRLDLSTLDADGLEISRMSNIAGGSLDGNTLTFDTDTVSYVYDTKSADENYAKFSVRLVADNYEALLPIDEAHFPDEAFRNVLLQTDYDKDGDGYFSKSEIAALTSMDAYGKGIKDLSGIKYLTALQSFTCRHNALTTLDVSALPELKILYCSENALTSLNISQNAKLRELDANNNALTTIDLSGNPKLGLADLSDNKLTTLDISYNPNLGFIGCSNNLLTTLDASVCPKMESIYCSNNQIRMLNLSNNKELAQVNCDGNALVAVDFSAANLMADFSDITGNRRTVSLESGNILDLSTLAADGLTVSRMSNIVGGTLEGNILTFNSETVTYDYDTKSASGSYTTIGITLHAGNFKKDGIDDITADDDTPVEYYNLQGIRIDADNLTPGIYVRRCGTDSRMIIVK